MVTAFLFNFISLKSRIVAALICGTLGVLLGSGCTSIPEISAEQAAQAEKQRHEELSLKEGDVIKISFPGVPNMDTTQPVRQDGRITLPLIGEFVVLGKTTDGLSKELLELYSSQLVSKEVNVTLVSSTYTIYITGAVLRPGKIVTDRRLTAFEAIMEAGGFDKTKANLKGVVITRQESGQNKSYTVDLQQVLDGKPSAPFYLKPFDSVYVPEKFTWF
jgi:polysaccharide biosynthesis/export protein